MRSRGHLLTSSAAPLAYLLGTFLLVIAGTMTMPIVCSLIYGEDDLFALVSSALVVAAMGAPLWWRFRNPSEINPKHALAAATIGWILVSAVSALPFMIHGSIPSFTDGFFEMMSGYTTTGSTILTDIEVLPHGLLLWRSETHLIGGMGFVTLAVLLLPHGMGGLRLFRADSSPGQVITRERFTSRNRDAIVYLWGIYLTLNIAQITLMCLGGMSLFDSMCHAFGTISTSGYSPYNDSIGHYDNAYFDWVITAFMFMGGMTFVLFFHISRREWRPVRINTEFRWYFGFTVAFCAIVAAALYMGGNYGFFDSLRYASFQVVSILTTTGYTTADYETWPPVAQMGIYTVCFIGACAGSTGSGIKVVHFAIIIKFMSAFIKRLYFNPLAVVSVRLNGERIDDEIIHLALSYFIMNIFLVIGGGLVMAISDGLDPISAMSSVIATLMNIGPGFGEVGPSKNFAFLSPFGKWFLSIMMVVGRLDIFSALVLFYPSFWRD